MSENLDTKSSSDTSTEEKIKMAAKSIFHKKGFAATRTRDIAEESGINLALLNYYFRSKQKLFDIIMLESLQGFLRSLTGVFNDQETSLDGKIEVIVANYIDLLKGEPDLPVFILSELRNNPEALIAKLDPRKMIMGSIFVAQLHKKMTENNIQISPIHFIMNIMGLVVFPFVASPLLKSLGDLDQETYQQLMEQRKQLIPQWIGEMFNNSKE